MPECSDSSPVTAERRRASRLTQTWVAQAGPIGAFVTDQRGRLVRFDQEFVRLLDLRSRPVAPRVLSIGCLLGEPALRALSQACQGQFARADCPLRDGRTLLLRARRSAHGARGWVEDVSALRRNETRLQFAALHDPLTGLMNRRGLHQRLAHAISHCAQQPAGLVFIDLDGFKQINDVFGHAAGDSVLRQFATRLRQRLTSRDFAARAGGDEFVVVLGGRSASEVQAWVETLHQRMSSHPFRHFSHELALRFSAGWIPLDAHLTPEATLEAADRECARTKAGNHECGGLLEPSLQSMLSGLHGTQAGPGLEVLTQPVHTTQAGLAEVGVEWLLRLRDHTGRLRRPSEFLPIMRQQGLAARADLWVMNRALDWLDSAKDPIASTRQPFCLIKLSAEALHDRRFQRQALRLLRAHGPAAASLRLEVNTRHLAKDSTAIIEFIALARAAGTRTVLGGLTDVPVWMPQLLGLQPVAIKVDSSLFREHRNDTRALAGIRTLVRHCHALGSEACAVRIESSHALETARQCDFDQVQGFLFGQLRPLSEGLPNASPSAVPSRT